VFYLNKIPAVFEIIILVRNTRVARIICAHMQICDHMLCLVQNNIFMHNSYRIAKKLI